jgi:hypothetical protein
VNFQSHLALKLSDRLGCSCTAGMEPGEALILKQVKLVFFLVSRSVSMLLLSARRFSFPELNSECSE